MKNDYDIRFNPPELSDERIERHMDFDALLNQFQEGEPAARPEAKRISLRPWAYTGVAIAAALVGVVFFSKIGMTDSADYDKAALAYFQSQPYNQPPLGNVQPRFVSQQVDAARGGEFAINEAAFINVPAAAFVDADGNAVAGKVELRYRAIDEMGAAFLAGMPLRYDSTGTAYRFASTRLFEVYAEQGGKPLQLHPAKGIDLTFSSDTKLNAAPAYNTYHLNATERRWDYKGKANSEFVVTDSPAGEDWGAAIEKAFQQEVARIKEGHQNALNQLHTASDLPSLPQKPQKRDPNRRVYDLGVNAKDIPELAKYEEVKWHLDGKEEELNVVGKVAWGANDVSIIKLSDGKYKMGFDNGSIKLELDATPILTKKEYETAMAEYERQKAAYDQAKAENGQAHERAVKDLEAKLAADLAAAEQNRDERLVQANSKDNTEALVERSLKTVFTMKELGAWSCNLPLGPERNRCRLLLKDKEGNPYQETTAYLADLDKNTLTKYYVGERVEILYNPQSRNQLWVVTPEGGIAVAYPEALKAIPSQANKAVLELTGSESPIESPEDVYSTLRLGKSM